MTKTATTNEAWCNNCHGYTHMPYCPSYQQLSYEQSASAIEGEPRSGMYGTCLRCFNDGWDAHKRGLHPANFHAGFAVPGIPHSCQTGEQLQYLGNRAEELSSLLAGMTTERDELREALRRMCNKFYPHACNINGPERTCDKCEVLRQSSAALRHAEREES